MSSTAGVRRTTRATACVVTYHPCAGHPGGICDLCAERHGSDCSCARRPAEGRGCPSCECAERHVCGFEEDRGLMMQPFRAPNTSGIRSASSGGGRPEIGAQTQCACDRVLMQRNDVEDGQWSIQSIQQPRLFSTANVARKLMRRARTAAKA